MTPKESHGKCGVTPCLGMRLLIAVTMANDLKPDWSLLLALTALGVMGVISVVLLLYLAFSGGLPEYGWSGAVSGSY